MTQFGISDRHKFFAVPVFLFFMLALSHSAKEDRKNVTEKKPSEPVQKKAASAKKEKNSPEKDSNEDSADEDKIQEEKERIEREIKARKEKEIRNFRKLVKEANQWQQSQMIRSYISYVENNALEMGELSDELKYWIEWSKQKADWLDPYKKRRKCIRNLQ